MPMVSRRTVLAAACIPAVSQVLGQRLAAAQTSEPLLWTLRPGTLATADDAPTLPVWGVAGASPGPTLFARRGQEVFLRVANELPEATALHWHGRAAAQRDGRRPAADPGCDPARLQL